MNTFWEYSGIDINSPLDASAALSNQPNSSSPTSSLITTILPGELVISLVGVQNSVNGIHAGNAFTVDSNQNGSAGAHLVATSTGTFQAQWDQSSAGTYAVDIASFKPAPGCIADDGATVSQISTTATSVPFGFISPNTFYQGCQDLTVSTNAMGGYSLTVQEKNAMQTPNGLYSIPDTTCDASNCSSVSSGTWVTPTKYGLGHTCTNVSGTDCNASFLNGTRFRPIANISAGTTNPITYIQGASGNDGGSGNTSPVNVAFPLNTTTGNLIVVGIGIDNDYTVTISDTQGNTFIHDLKEAGQGTTHVYHAANIKGGPDTISVNLGTWGHFMVLIHEYSGVDKYAPMDVTSTQAGVNSGSLDSGSKTTTFGNELIFGFGYTPLGTSTFSAGTNFGLRQTNKTSGESGASEDRVVNSAASYNAIMTMNPGNWWNMTMATFKASPQSGQVLMSSGSAVTSSTGRVKYRLSASPNQPAGTYSTVITYTLTPTY